MTDPGFTVEVVPHTCHSCVVCGAKTPVASPDRVRLEALVEWRDHTPSGYETMEGYGAVSCSCGWDSDGHDQPWTDHIDEAARSRADGEET
jgi:hypothetical protein